MVPEGVGIDGEYSHPRRRGSTKRNGPTALTRRRARCTLPQMPWTLGDIVDCRTELRTDLGIGPGPGILLELRRNDAKALFWETRRCGWIEHRHLSPWPGDPGFGLGMAQRLIRLLEAKSFNVVEAEREGGTIEVFFPSLPDDLVDRVRSLLGASKVELSFEPGGMTKMMARIRYRSGG